MDDTLKNCLFCINYNCFFAKQTDRLIECSHYRKYIFPQTKDNTTMHPNTDKPIKQEKWIDVTTDGEVPKKLYTARITINCFREGFNDILTYIENSTDVDESIIKIEVLDDN